MKTNFVIFCLVWVTLSSIETRSNIPNRLMLTEEFYESRGSVYSDDIDEAGKFLKNFNTKADDLLVKDGLKNWEYETDLTDRHMKERVKADLEVSEFFLTSSENATQIKTLDLPPKMHRQISLIRRSGEPTSYAMRREIREKISKMTSIFGKAKVKRDGQNYTISDLDDIMEKSRNRKELNWAWKSWRDKVGPPMKNMYSSLIDLLNVGAREHGWIDYGDYARSNYEMGDDLELNLDRVWNEIEPLYKELHAYVRYRLAKTYKISKRGCIPANLFGDMFAQNWQNIFPLVKPQKSSRTFDVTNELKNQGYTVSKMVHLAEQFFTSIGLDKMPDSFWETSVLTKPTGKEMVCHPSAWDISNKDVRIKMCTKINQEDLTTIHHEMGHVEYFLAYKDQPNTFRAGANPGFHEAIGDTISLSVETPKYLNEVNLLKSASLSKDDTISFLLNQALRRVAPIPYNLLVDKWRWRVYEGNITESVYNKEWWKLRVKYQGVEPPVSRATNAFDPASKYHISANVAYIAYFVSYVLQFQFHKAFCKEAGHKGPLHTCSIYKSKEAGRKLRQMLEAGRSKPWPKILKAAVGDDDLKADAILEYFQPLRDWLQDYRKTKKYPIGWKNAMSKPVLQKKIKKYEAGQERSGILKTNSGDVSLSINIPSLTLNELLKKSNSTNNDTATEAGLTSAKTPSVLDLAKLLDSAKALSIKSSEVSSKDNKSKSSTEDITINTDKAQQNPKTMKDAAQQNPKTMKNSDNHVDKANAPQFQIFPIESLIPSSYALKSNGSTEAVPQKESSSLKGSNTNEATPQSNHDHSQPSKLPLAVSERPQADFPSTAVSEKQPKQNPKTAGISKESSNPATAAVPHETKPNPAPANQIALVPVSLPSNVLSALRNALNGTQSIDLSMLKSAENTTTTGNADLTNNLQQLNNNVTSPSSVIAANNASEKQNASSNESHHDHLSQNTTGYDEKVSEINEQISPSKLNTSKILSEDSISSSPEADSQLIDRQNQSSSNSVLNSTNPFSNITTPITTDNGFTTTQNVMPCKRSDDSCLLGKVTTVGDSLPSSSGFGNSKQTISVSPSLLIQKLIEHHVAEKSTPDPVVNAPGNSSTKSTEEVAPQRDEESKGTTPVDMDKLVKLLTGSSKNANTTVSQTNPTISQEALAGQLLNTSNFNDKDGYANIKSNEKGNYSNEVFPGNCSDLRKRGISLTFNCKDIEKAEKASDKGGTLSISPNELIQRLLGSKSLKNEVNRKTIPSAHVVKTRNGFQLNFDLNPKDKIPLEVTKLKKKNPMDRQQHVDVYNTPKGMIVKPKSSVQLLKPQFVPVKSKDNLELGGKEGRK